jgi:hypothetical protein
MLSTIRLWLTFYQSFLLASLVVNVCCFYLFVQLGISAFAVLFWFKVITFFLTYLFINSYKGHEFYFYQNLGISKSTLWLTTIAVESTIFAFVLFLASLLR